MDWKQIEAHWSQLRRTAKLRWEALTDDDWARIDGKCDALIGTLQLRYGKGKDEIEDDVARWALREVRRIRMLKTLH